MKNQQDWYKNSGDMANRDNRKTEFSRKNLNVWNWASRGLYQLIQTGKNKFKSIYMQSISFFIVVEVDNKDIYAS